MAQQFLIELDISWTYSYHYFLQTQLFSSWLGWDGLWEVAEKNLSGLVLSFIALAAFPSVVFFFFSFLFFNHQKFSYIYGNYVQKFNTMSRVWDWKGRPAFLEGEHKNFWTEETVVTFMDWVAEGKKPGFEVGLKMRASLWVGGTKLHKHGRRGRIWCRIFVPCCKSVCQCSMTWMFFPVLLMYK